MAVVGTGQGNIWSGRDWRAQADWLEEGYQVYCQVQDQELG